MEDLIKVLEMAGTVSSAMNDVKEAVLGLLALFAIPFLLMCFFGYKIQKITVTIGGVLIGGMVGFLVAALARRIELALIVVILLGALGGFIAFKLYRFGIFMLYWLIGSIVFFVLFLVSGAYQAIGLAFVFGLIVGVLALVLHKGYIIVTTAVSGGVTVGAGIGILIGSIPVGLLFGIVLSALGIWVQYRLEEKSTKISAASGKRGVAAPQTYAVNGNVSHQEALTDVSEHEEYVLLSTHSPKLQCVKSKVFLQSFSLSKDNGGNTYLKANFSSINDKCLVAVYFKVVGYDIAGEKLGEQTYSMIDLDIEHGEPFSSGTIQLFDNRVRKTDIMVTQVVERDGCVIKFNDEDLIAMPELTQIREILSPELAELIGLQKNELYLSQNYAEDVWVCTCGTVSCNRCVNCGRTADESLQELSEQVVAERISGMISKVANKVAQCCAADELNEHKQKLIRIASLLEETNCDKKLLEECQETIRKTDEKIAEIMQGIRERKQKLKKIGLLAAIALIGVLLVFVIAKIIIGLPPSQGRIKSDAEQYITDSFGIEYKLTEADITKTIERDYCHAYVETTSKNKVNSDILRYKMGIYYQKEAGRFEPHVSGLAYTVHSGHTITETDDFGIPKMVLLLGNEAINIDAAQRYELVESGDLAIEFIPDYEKAMVSEDNTSATVPVKIKLEYGNSSVDTEIILNYQYDGNYQWYCTDLPSFNMTMKTEELTEPLMKELISGTTVEHMGELLPGEYLTVGQCETNYAAGFSAADMTADFIWDNGQVKFDGTLNAQFSVAGAEWIMTDIHFVDCSEPVRYKAASEEELRHIMQQIIPEHCTERNNVSNIEIVSFEELNDGLLVTSEYISENEGFFLTNSVTALMESDIMTGYRFKELCSEKVKSLALTEEVHEKFEMNYELVCTKTRPVGVPSSGTTMVTLDISADGSAVIQCSLGNLPLKVTGKLVYPGNALSLSSTEHKIAVNYDLLLKGMNGSFVFMPSSSLVYDGKLTGSITFGTLAAGVESFTVIFS